ncbi:NAC domain-containing protein 53 [Rosa chinensis]|uniref:NAC domain-containing protein 53 n=1 Tax=Rosa chinensis TaxID=74649 RepID=UPI000D08C604|nr:NAC domain-containing protein 53 [Rosa chinensis]
MKMDRGTYIIVKEDMKFFPSEDQLIKFLKMKIDGRYSGFISEINLYKHEPWDLPALSVVKFSEEWFFFTENSRKYKTSDRSNRQTEKGYWHETSKEVPVVNTNDKSKVIGRKRFLVFYKGRASRKEKTNWVMQEYFVPEGEHETNLVLCRIKQKSVGSSREDSNKGIVFDIECGL